YFSNNNLAYNLNQLGLYAEAEPHCREAIRTEPLRHNAHKNLGVSLQGQGRWAEAADSYGRATEACPFDPRAAGHMEAMLKEHPEVRGMLEAREKAAAPEVSGAEQLQVVLHKGEQGLGEHAVETLMKVFGHSPEMAAKLMAEAECRGQAIVQVEERDLAVMHREMLHAAGFRVEVQTL
ncbi:MAG: ATP-dependent Clp protease adaptor ClpS, partial [bacterium]